MEEWTLVTKITQLNFPEVNVFEKTYRGEKLFKREFGEFGTNTEYRTLDMREYEFFRTEEALLRYVDILKTIKKR